MITQVISKSKLYDILCSLTDKLINQYNPCKIEKDSNNVISCKYASPCCDGCEYLKENGCSINCLGCKLGFCHHKIISSELFIKLFPLFLLAEKHHIIYIRTSKEEALTQTILGQSKREIYRRTLDHAICLRYKIIAYKLIKKGKLCKPLLLKDTVKSAPISI